MSEQYPGGFITKSPPTPAGPYETSSGYGMWNLSQQAAYKAQGLWPTAGSFPPDAKFNYVTMLLHGDGTNGAQNNTFLDSSTNNFTITRNGNSTQGSFSPYGSNWSNYFNGSTDYLSLTNTAALTMGTGDFTVEAWVYLPSVAVYSGIVSLGRYLYNGGILRVTDSAKLQWYFNDASLIITSTDSVSANTWTHVAVVRSSGTTKLYINGVNSGSSADSSNYNSTYATVIGADNQNSPSNLLAGYISNVRVAKGIAVYTSNFTPSTSPLGITSGGQNPPTGTQTSLLTCQSNRIVDSSSSPGTITVTGTPSVQRFNPFGTSTEYSTATIGGSGYFDGTGDELSTASGNTSLTFGTGAYTVEFWVYSNVSMTSYTSNEGPVFIYCDATDGWGMWSQNASGQYLKVATRASGSVSLPSNSILVANQWNHVVAVRSGTGSNQFAIFVNGTRVLNSTDSNNWTVSGAVKIGGISTSGYYLNGYVGNLRVVKGSAAYDPTSSTLTVPTAPLTAITNTALLMSYTNGAIYDNAMMTDLETVGNAQISTSVKKFGTGSMYFDGTGDYLKAVSSAPNFQFGTGDFTIEMWVYTSNLAAYQTLFDTRTSDTSSAYGLFINDSGYPYWFDANGTQTSTIAVTSNTWTYLAFLRGSGTLRIYVNGVQGSFATNTNAMNPTGIPRIGMNVSASAPYLGYIDDFRVTKGYARTPTTPTAAFPNTGPT